MATLASKSTMKEILLWRLIIAQTKQYRENSRRERENGNPSQSSELTMGSFFAVSL